MKNWFAVFCFLTLFSMHAEEETTLAQEILAHYSAALEEPEAVIFTPPENWLAADPNALPKSVKAMVVGKGEHEYPPSINIGTEKYDGSIKSYLKNIKMINEAQHATWKDLGTISTESGNASLSQVDMKTEWGDVRLMHAIIIRYGTAYILTAAALKEEFSTFYQDFFKSMRSLKINKDVYEMVKSPEKRARLQTNVQQLKNSWTEFVNRQEQEEALEPFALKTFSSEQFQETAWLPFLSKLDQDFAELGDSWKEHMCNKAKQELGLDY